MLEVASFKARIELQTNMSVRIKSTRILGGKQISIVLITYQFDANNVPVLSVILVVSIVHECVVFENCHPIFVLFHVFTCVGGACWSDKLLHGNCISVEILKGDVREEGNLVILVE